LAAARLLSPAQLVTVKRPNETTMDLEETIAELVERKREALVGSPQWTLANNALIALR
jgi:hypothetical protein